MVLQDDSHALYPGDWYWMASRAIPGEAITEFPYFTFLYADLHAHLMAMPFVVFSVAWGMSFLFSQGKWSQNKKKQVWFYPQLAAWCLGDWSTQTHQHLGFLYFPIAQFIYYWLLIFYRLLL